MSSTRTVYRSATSSTVVTAITSGWLVVKTDTTGNPSMSKLEIPDRLHRLDPKSFAAGDEVLSEEE